MAKSNQHFFVGEIVKMKIRNDMYKVTSCYLIRNDINKHKLHPAINCGRDYEYCYTYTLERVTDGHKDMVRSFHNGSERVSGDVNNWEVIQMVEERLWNL